MELCPCGSGKTYQDCCQPIHLDASNAITPEQLMRSRYCAHVKQLTDFVVETYHPDCHAEQERDAIQASIMSQWVGLDVMGTEPGRDENEGFVTFSARFIDDGQEYQLTERSRFIRLDGRWYYIDGTFPDQGKPRDCSAGNKVGRNDPCPCGSGKKFKKCCGRN